MTAMRCVTPWVIIHLQLLSNDYMEEQKQRSINVELQVCVWRHKVTVRLCFMLLCRLNASVDLNDFLFSDGWTQINANALFYAQAFREIIVVKSVNNRFDVRLEVSFVSFKMLLNTVHSFNWWGSVTLICGYKVQLIFGVSALTSSLPAADTQACRRVEVRSGGKLRESFGR